MRSPPQLRLLFQRRFLPYFVAQALAACNENLLRNLLVLAATYHTLRYTRTDPRILGILAGGLFLLPFVLLAGLSGQLADRFDKARIIRIAKLAELGIAGLAAVGFFTHSLALLLLALFLTGVESTFLAPAKYALLPRVLRPGELLGGNALIETGTFGAILAATIGAAFMAGRAAPGATALVLCALALTGWLASLAIPEVAPNDPDFRVDRKLWRATWDSFRVARERRTVWLALLGLSWFWFYGMLVLTQLPVYTRYVLNADEQVYRLLLAVFAAAIGLGSPCARHYRGARSRSVLCRSARSDLRSLRLISPGYPLPMCPPGSSACMSSWASHTRCVCSPILPVSVCPAAST